MSTTGIAHTVSTTKPYTVTPGTVLQLSCHSAGNSGNNMRCQYFKYILWIGLGGLVQGGTNSTAEVEMPTFSMTRISVGNPSPMLRKMANKLG